MRRKIIKQSNSNTQPKNCNMKIKTNNAIHTTFCLLLSLLLCSLSYSQATGKALTKIYLQSGVGGASHSGFVSEVSVQGVIKNNWVATLSYHNIDMEPKNLPSNFDAGMSMFFSIPIPGEKPNVDMHLISLTMGKYFKSGRNTWFTTEAGLSAVNAKNINFSPKDGSSSTGLFPLFGTRSSNYEFTEDGKKTTIGAMLKTDFNWAFSSLAGLGRGVFANINSIQSPVGFHIKLIIGKMNREKKS